MEIDIRQTNSQTIKCEFCSVEHDLGRTRRGMKKFITTHLWTCTIEDKSGTLGDENKKVTPYFTLGKTIFAEVILPDVTEAE